MTPSIQQLRPPGPQQGPPIHAQPGQSPNIRCVTSQVSHQMPQGSTQIGLSVSQSHVDPSSGPVVPGGRILTGTVGLPPQIGAQQPSTLTGIQGHSIPTHVSSTTISPQPSGVIQVPSATGSGSVSVTNQALPAAQVSNIPTMQGIVTISTAQPFQPAVVPTTSNETPQATEDIKPRTAELISFD